MSKSKEQSKRGLIPMSDIDDEARELAVAWVGNFPGRHGSIMPDIAQKQKLASDVMNYAQDRILIRSKQYQDKIGEQIVVIEEMTVTIAKLKQENAQVGELESEVQRLKSLVKQVQALTQSV